MQLRAVCSMSLSVPDAQVLPNKISVAIWVIATVDVFGSMVQLMTIEVLCSRVALSTAFMFTFEFLFCIRLCNSAALLGGLLLFHGIRGWLMFLWASRHIV